MVEVKADALERSFDAFENDDDGVAALKAELELLKAKVASGAIAAQRPTLDSLLQHRGNRTRRSVGRRDRRLDRAIDRPCIAEPWFSRTAAWRPECTDLHLWVGDPADLRLDARRRERHLGDRPDGKHGDNRRQGAARHRVQLFRFVGGGALVTSIEVDQANMGRR